MFRGSFLLAFRAFETIIHFRFQIIQINLSSNFYAIKACLPDMKKQNWGRIINISSAHGKVASANKIAYVAAKHGVLGMTKVQISAPFILIIRIGCSTRNSENGNNLQCNLPWLGPNALG